MNQSTLPSTERFLRHHQRMEDGRIFPLGQVLRIVRHATANPEAWFAETLRSKWMGGHGRDIVWQFRNYVRDEINRRGGLVLREASPQRIERRLAVERAARGCECRWCGSRIPWRPLHSRFCEASCARAYLS